MERPLTSNIQPGGEPLSLRDYEKVGGYQAVRKALTSMTPIQVIDVMRESDLKGRGGAGFPTAAKWASVPLDSKKPRHFVADADEMEPGTFKDRVLMEGDPHQLIEGVIIGSFATEAESAFIFIRWEYTRAQQHLRRAIAEAYENGYLGKNILGSGFNLELHLHVSAGRYICGEGTALVRSLEGDRAIPHSRVPRQTECGLWGKPTILNNVETLCNVPHIINKGGEWFRGLSRCEDGGTKMYSASGRIKRPGLWELPMGTPLSEIIEEHAGGMREGYRLRAVMPGGASTDFLLAENLDVPMNFGSVQKAGSRLGTGAVIVLDDKTCPVGMVHNLEYFFAHESCGWCTPCREGLPWATSILHAIEHGNGIPEDLDTLQKLTWMMGMGKTFCALAPGAMEPLASALKFFRDDFERHIKEKQCPWR